MQAMVLTLESLWEIGDAGVLAVRDLRNICQGITTSISDKSIALLKEFALMTEMGEVASEIRNIVLCALEGEGSATTLVSPLARPELTAHRLPAPRKTYD
jgi:hypothetical protein